MEFEENKRDITDPRKQDFDDLQNEIAGRETGRRARFMPNSTDSVEAKRKKREEERMFRTQLEALLADPIYRAKYDDVMRDLGEAERAADAALEKLARLIEQTELAIRDMEEKAAKLPDGTLVFRDANGTVRRADGSVVDDDLTDTILWTGNEPSLEDYQHARRQLDDLTENQHDSERYRQDVLGSARDRLTDPDNPPPDLNSLDGIRNDFIKGMPSIVQEHMPETTSTMPQVEAADIAVPTLSTKP